LGGRSVVCWGALKVFAHESGRKSERNCAKLTPMCLIAIWGDD
jgi:hypothetical protein